MLDLVIWLIVCWKILTFSLACCFLPHISVAVCASVNHTSRAYHIYLFSITLCLDSGEKRKWFKRHVSKMRRLYTYYWPKSWCVYINSKYNLLINTGTKTLAHLQPSIWPEAHVAREWKDVCHISWRNMLLITADSERWKKLKVVSSGKRKEWQVPKEWMFRHLCNTNDNIHFDCECWQERLGDTWGALCGAKAPWSQ